MDEGAGQPGGLPLGVALGALEHLPLAIAIIDAEGIVRFANAAAERLYGWPRDEAIGKSALVLGVAPTETSAAAQLMARLAEGEAWSGRFPIRRRDGTRLTTWFHVAAIPGFDSPQPAVITVAVDLADLPLDPAATSRAAEVRAEEANLLVDALLHSVPVGLGIFDSDTRFVRVNAALAEINGVPAEAHVGHTIAELLTGIPATVADSIREVFATGRTVGQVEVVGETPKLPGVERHWIVSYFPITRGEDVLWVGATAVEVTEWRVAEHERARLLVAEREARQAAELAAERLARLQIVTGRLADASDLETVADIVVQHGALGVAATAGGFLVLEDDELRIVRTFGMSDEVVAEFGRIPLSADLPVAEAVRTGRVVLLSSADERDVRYPSLTGLAADSSAFAAVPVSLEGRPRGAIVLGWSDERPFADGEESFLLALSRQAAQALERARLYEAERAARAEAERAWQRMRFLADASRVLSSSLDDDVTLRGLAELIVPEVADTCLIHLIDGDELRLVVAESTDERRRSQLAVLAQGPNRDRAPRLLGLVAASGRPVVAPAIDEAFWRRVASSDAELERLVSLDISSGIAVAIRVQERILGVLTLATHDGDRSYGDTDLSFVEDLAGRAAVAIENARSHRARTEVAQTLQRSLLPPHLPTIPGLDLAQRYHSLGDVEVGGDFFDVFPAGDGRWGVAMGDVCGKGVAAAALTALARYTVRAGAIDQGEASVVLRLLNRAILDSDVGERFCTIVYATVEPNADGDGARVVLACGGHPQPLLLATDGTVTPVGEPGTAIGLFEEIELTEVECDLRPGDALVLFTDGFVEVRSPEGVFDPDLLPRALATAAGQPAEGIAETVDRAVQEFEGGRQRDDMALLILKVPDRR